MGSKIRPEGRCTRGKKKKKKQLYSKLAENIRQIDASVCLGVAVFGEES